MMKHPLKSYLEIYQQNVNIVEVDIDNIPEVEEFYSIFTLPQITLFKDGKIIGHIDGKITDQFRDGDLTSEVTRRIFNVYKK